MLSEKNESIEYTENKVKGKEITLIVLLIIAFTLFFLLNSPSNPLVQGDCYTDSSVFKTVALMMEKGFMPYRDSFDHKGPLLYILNFLGNKLSYYSGICFIELIFLAVAFLMMFLTARLFTNAWKSLITFFLSMILMFSYFEGGNLTEEYAMSFIAISLYIFIDYFENNKISKIRLIICGASFGCVLMLRPNMIALWLVMSLAVLFKKIKEKNYKELSNFILFFVVGILMVIIPIIIWLLKNDALNYFWKDYIEFNQKYTSSSGGLALLKNKINSFVHFASTGVYIIALFSQYLVCYKKRNILNIAYLILMIVTLVFICISGMEYGHYGMILVPLVIYPIARLFKEIDLCDIYTKKTGTMLLLALILLVGINPYKLFFTDSVNRIKLINKENISQEVNDICDLLDKYNIKEDDAISVYGNWDVIYVVSKRQHATTYSYQFPIGQVMPSIMDDYIEQLENEMPKIIIVQKGTIKTDDSILNFLNNDAYALIWPENGSNNNEDSALVYIKNK